MNNLLIPSSPRSEIIVLLTIVGLIRLGINIDQTMMVNRQALLENPYIQPLILRALIELWYFGGIKLGTGGLVRAYGGVTSECLKNAPTLLVKSKVPMGVEVSFDLLGLLYHQLQSFQAADVKQDYETGKDDTTMVTFKVDFDKADSVEDAIKASCGRDILFFKH
ncbi:uncharacterized protein [Spinacia oleracea]|uniref:Uncharacterized protein isoform X3 n=1 Tax=Spinacia oleracea TaxID=3562 RepID=A0A9R0IA78_SPIOL|nr:uncharacterized protein LOC110785249 isoform X3 [Spinacia oleracea]